MTTRESLLEAIGELSDADAERLFPLVDTTFLEWLEATSLSTSNADLLAMPLPIRRLLSKYEGRFYTAEDANSDEQLAEEWESGTGADLELSDA